ncbi:MAG: YybH family protein [Chthoniobacterales bacterium]
MMLAAGCRKPISTAPDREQIASTVSAFHSALARGDRAEALGLLAPDAQILESGHRQSREEYAEEHLAGDIAFAQAVTDTRGAMIVRQEGHIGWTSLTGRSSGTFRGQPVDSVTAELMVLAHGSDGWRIRAIHWSAHSGGTQTGGH